MRILLVEDTQRKSDNVVAMLTSDTVVRRSDISLARSVSGAVAFMRDTLFDLVILDIQLPLRDGGVPEKDAGIGLLRKMERGVGVQIPSHVVGLTAYEDLEKLAGPEFGKLLFFVVRYDETTDTWRDALASHIGWVEAHLELKNVQSISDTTLVIVCALETPEASSVRALGDVWTDIVIENDPTIYRTAKWASPNGELKIVMGTCLQMGMVPAATLTSKMIARFQPKYVAMVGICAGVEGTSCIGDIVFVDDAWEYSFGKIRVGSKSAFQFDVDPRHLSVKPSIKSVVQKVLAETRILADIESGWHADVPKGYKLRAKIGPMASGPFVVANSELVKAIVLQSRKLLGIDMEAAGLAYSVENYQNSSPFWIVVKSVSDLASAAKNDDHQAFAAYTSACFLRELFVRGYLA